jgi:hypothetical protein
VLAALVWPLAGLPPDHALFAATTAFAAAVALHVAVDAARFGRSLVA